MPFSHITFFLQNEGEVCYIRVSSDPDDPTKPATDYCLDQADGLARTAETVEGVQQKLSAALYSIIGMVAMVVANVIHASKYQWENGVACQYFDQYFDYVNYT